MLSGRTNDEVNADPDFLWRSDLPAARAAQPVKPMTPAAPTDDELAALDSFGSSGVSRHGGRCSDGSCR